MIKKSVTIFITVLIFGCGTHKSQFEGVPFEKQTTFEGTKFTQSKLDSLTNFLETNLETTGLIILKNGNNIYDYGNIKEVTYIASCRKSVLSILYGKYVENGTIDLNQTIGEIGIDEDDGLLDIEKTAKIDNIITSRSGFFINQQMADMMRKTF